MISCASFGSVPYGIFKGSSFSTLPLISDGSNPSYGTSLEISSHKSVPKAKMSTDSSYYLFWNNSGAIYAGVPEYCIDPLFKSAYINIKEFIIYFKPS